MKQLISIAILFLLLDRTTMNTCLENSLAKKRGNAQLKVHFQSHCESRFLLP